jgi:N-acyl-D-aspartate/D-glutamate deacylase
MYPYDASYTTIGILFPPPGRARGEKATLAYLHDRVEKRNGPEATLFGSGPFAGKTLAAAAEERKVPFERVLYDLGPSGAGAAYFVMDHELEERLLVDPFVSIGTDGGGGDPHPRSHGTFTRVLTDVVRDEPALGLEGAVHKMTGLAAATLGLDGDRGCVAQGCAADLAVFAPDELRTRADFVSPRVLAEGMRFVVVNGVVARDGDRLSRSRSGRALRPPSSESADAHAGISPLSARGGAGTR